MRSAELLIRTGLAVMDIVYYLEPDTFRREGPAVRCDKFITVGTVAVAVDLTDSVFGLWFLVAVDQ